MRELKVDLPFPGRSRESRLVRLVHHTGDPTSTTNRLVSGDILHFGSLNGSRNIVLGDVVRKGVLGEVVEHNTSACSHGCGGWHRASVLYPHAPANVCAWNAGREI